jgi:hypothetical protein
MAAVFLFAFGLLLRLWFAAAAPDGGAGWHIGFQGDVPILQDHAARLAHGLPDGRDLLPLRPPAMLWLGAWLWDGEGATAWRIRLVFAALGALAAPLLWQFLRRHVDAAVAFAAALLCAASSNLLLLASGPHAEPLYLVLVLGALLVHDRLALARGAAWALLWGALHGAACLVRAEHVLVAVAWSALAWRGGVRLRVLAAGLAAALACVLPWQLHANRLVAAYNSQRPELPPAALPWQPEALARLRAMPGFQQAWLHAFITDTARVRGRDVVEAADLDAVREAFGVDPAPLRPAFVTIQGPLDFWFANTPEGARGFTRRALDRPLPLAGGAHRYPPDLARRLPADREFSFQHPGHVHALVHGYALGLRELAADPAAALARLAGKLWWAAAGATGGLGGAAVPVGLSGERRPVDCVAATGVWPALWRAFVLLVAAVGCWRLRRERWCWPLLAFAALRVLVVAAYFGHARHGALCLPVVALGVAMVAVPPLQRRASTRALRSAALAAAAGLLALEWRRAGAVEVYVDGRRWTQPAGGQPDWDTHRIDFR